MKKKIKDLTIGEVVAICKKHFFNPSCNSCELRNYCGFTKYIKEPELMEEEIEVE